jgi:hypothetical protein
MLRDLLTCFDGVATWPCDEINYIWRHYWATFPNDELQPEQATPRVQNYIRHCFQRLSQQRRARWVIEKTCANSLRVGFVHSIFPDAKFVFVTRDGRDVVASAMKRWHAKLDFRYTMRKARFVPLGDFPIYATRFGRNRLHRLVSRQNRLKSWGPRFEGIDEMLSTCTVAEICAEQWSRSVQKAICDLARINHARVYSLRYDEFVGHPESHLNRLAEFIGVPHQTSPLETMIRGVSTGSVGKWRSELQAHVLEAIDRRLQAGVQALFHWESCRRQQDINLIAA